MISTKTIMKDEFTKANGLEYEDDCDHMDVDNVNGSDANGTRNGLKKDNESTANGTGGNQNGSSTESAATTSGNDSFSTPVFIQDQRPKLFRGAKMLETSIANLKKKLQSQPNSSTSTTDCGSDALPTREAVITQATNRTTVPQYASEESPLEAEDYSGDSSEEGSQTAVERSLAAMSKSRASISKRSTSSHTSYNDAEDGDGRDDEDNDDEESKSDAFLNRIFNCNDGNTAENHELSDISGSSEMLASPSSGTSLDKGLSGAVRRKRQRRNPVWPYFAVKDGLATCKHCNYSTRSVFSTNLKVHLRTHHHDLFQEVLRAEEEQQQQQQQPEQEQIAQTECSTTSVASGTTTISAAAPITPYMHRVTTTALPAFGSGSSSNNNSGKDISSDIFASAKSNLTHAAALLSILNQRGTFRNAITTASSSISSSTTTSRPGFAQAFPDPQILAQHFQRPDLTKTLPDFLKVLSEASVKSGTDVQQSSSTKSPLSTGTNNNMAETLRTFSKTPQKPSSSVPKYNIAYSRGKVEKNSSQTAAQESTIVLKRRRLRRHPVWRFFKDVGDGTKTVKCINCSFSTSSPFSTNLKMHLKAHHKSDYRLILVLETRQRLEEGISPVPETVRVPLVGSEKRCAEDSANDDEADEEPAKKKPLSIFEDEGFPSMTNTERINAMIDLAAGVDTQPADLQDSIIDYIASGNTNRRMVSGINQASRSVDTDLLEQLGLAKSDVPSAAPLQQRVNFQTTGSVSRSHPVNNSATLDTTKSVRTISKRLPTGEVVKVRQTRKCVENAAIHTSAPTTTTSPVAAATATVSTTTPIVPSRDLAAAIATSEEDLKSSKEYKLAMALAKADAFELVDFPEFRLFIEMLDPSYRLPDSGYFKQLWETSVGTRDLPSAQDVESGSPAWDEEEMDDSSV